MGDHSPDSLLSLSHAIDAALRAPAESAPSSGSGARLSQKEADSLLTRVRTDPKRWRVALDLFTSVIAGSVGLISEDSRNNALFWALSVFEYVIKQCTTESESSESLMRITRVLMNSVQKLFSLASTVPSSRVSRPLKAKMAQVLASVILRTYPTRWKLCFADLSSMTVRSDGSSSDSSFSPESRKKVKLEMVEFFLFVLSELNYELVERKDNLSPQIMERNMQIKESLRHSPRDLRECIVNDLWFVVLLSKNDPSASKSELERQWKIQRLCLQTIGRFIPWIPIELIASKPFLSFVYRLLDHKSKPDSDSREWWQSRFLRCSGVACLTEIINKRMEADKKIGMIREIGVIPALKATQAYNSHESAVCGMIDPQSGLNEEEAFAAGVACAMSSLGKELLVCCQDLSIVARRHRAAEEALGVDSAETESSEGSEDILKHLNLPALYSECLDIYDCTLQYFNHPQFRVSRCVVSFLEDYWNTVKSRNTAGQKRAKSEAKRLQSAQSKKQGSAEDESSLLSERERKIFQQTLVFVAKQFCFPSEEESSDEERAELEEFRDELDRIFLNLCRVAPHHLVSEISKQCSQMCYQIRQYHEQFGGDPLLSSPWIGGSRSQTGSHAIDLKTVALEAECKEESPERKPSEIAHSERLKFPVELSRIESTLHMLYRIPEEFDRSRPMDEVIRSNQVLGHILSQAIESGLGNCGSHHIRLQTTYFDLLFRYSVYLIYVDDSRLGHVLHTYVSEFGIQCKHAQIRSRAAYRLCCFVKSVAVKRQGRVAIKKYMHRLLPFVKELLKKEASREGECSVHFDLEDISYLAEIYGLLTLCLKPENGQRELSEIADELCNPLKHFTAVFKDSGGWKSAAMRVSIADRSTRLVRCVQSLIKWYKWSTVSEVSASLSKGYVSILKGMLSAVISVWSILRDDCDDLRREVISLIHKSSYLLGLHFVSQVPPIFELLLEDRMLDSPDHILVSLQLVLSTLSTIGQQRSKYRDYSMTFESDPSITVGECFSRFGQVLSDHFPGLMRGIFACLSSLESSAMDEVEPGHNTVIRFRLLTFCFQIIEKIMVTGYHSILSEPAAHFAIFGRILKEMTQTLTVASQPQSEANPLLSQLCKHVCSMFATMVNGFRKSNEEMRQFFDGPMLDSSLCFLLESPVLDDFHLNVGSFRIAKEVWYLHGTCLKYLSPHFGECLADRLHSQDTAQEYCRLLSALNDSRKSKTVRSSLRDFLLILRSKHKAKR